MGFKKTYQREMHDAGRLDKVQALTQANTATRITNYGVTTITASTSAGASSTFFMDPPVQGVRKTIIVDSNSTDAVIIAQKTTAITYFGSTHNLATATTGATFSVLDLVGVSATAWARVSSTAGWAFAGSTVSG